jgi:hypothetical protein
MYYPRTANFDGHWLVFYAAGFPLARCEMHPDRDYQKEIPGTALIFPDAWDNFDHAAIRLKPETLRIIEHGASVDHDGYEQVWFDDEQILEALPALKAECERRPYWDAYKVWWRKIENWVREADKASKQGLPEPEMPEPPVFEPARAEYEALQRAEGTDQKRTAYDTYWRLVPMVEIEKKAQDEVRLRDVPANALMGGNALAIAGLAGRPIDEFNEGWRLERWPGSPQLPASYEQSFPAIFHQLNHAIARIVTMAQKPRKFRGWRSCGSRTSTSPPIRMRL